MKNERLNNNTRSKVTGTSELIARRNAALRRKAMRRKHTGIVAAGICVFAALAGFTALGITFAVNNGKQDMKAPAMTAQIAEAGSGAQKAGQTAITQGSETAETTAEQTTAEGSSEAAGSSGETAQQSTPAGVHHSGAVWDGKGTPLHIFANGKTSYGYDWTCEGGGGIMHIGCDYTFANHSYDFMIMGAQPGTASLTIYYNTDDNTRVPITVNFKVDENLVVTQI